MFQNLIFALLKGDFICQVTHHEGYAYLQDESGLRAANDHLNKIGLQVICTEGGSAFFAAHLDGKDPDKRAAKKVFEEIKHILRPCVEFLSLVMDVQKSDSVLFPGSLIEPNRLMASIDANSAYLSELQKVATLFKAGAAETNNRGRLIKILKRFEDDGFMLMIDEAREIYQVTGKIEYFHKALAYLMEHDGIETEEAMPAQGDLF